MKTFLASCGLLAAVLLIGCSERNPAQTTDVGTGGDQTVIPGKDSTTPGKDGNVPPGDGPVTPPGDGPVTPPGDGPVVPPSDSTTPKPDVAVKKCTSTSQCIPYACYISTGVCRTSCSSSSHCATAFGYYCNSAGKCVKPPACTTVNDPKCNGYDCNVSTGTCRLTCSYNSHCQTGYTCSNGACIKQVTCTTVNDPVCGAFKCDVNAGICRTYCTSSTQHCAAGNICANNVCVASTKCTTDAQCNGFECNTSQGVCYVSCNCSAWNNSTCATGFSCDPTGTKCIKPKACTSNSQCGAYDCSGGSSVCRTCCSNMGSQYYCASGYHCSSGACVK